MFSTNVEFNEQCFVIFTEMKYVHIHYIYSQQKILILIQVYNVCKHAQGAVSGRFRGELEGI